ncbi:hypothetical protein [Endozoicomonas ascidiicola]|uniref:hypothetical protein n=1 Tax=Endozoicomonas ascidiicola TaxID=1698521 RepID=UPI000833A0E8|nr:hypothetical protein [Endozoicomonas ascidiicola]
MQKYLLAGAVPLIAILVMLQGCDKSSDCPDISEVVLEDLQSVDKGIESYSCTSPSKAGVLELTWCKAQKQFESQHGSANADEFVVFLKGFRDGYAQASDGADSRVNLFEISDQSEPLYDSGYKEGYINVLDAMGISEFNCSTQDMASEYRDRWCEASVAFQQGHIGIDNNPIVKSRFIDGYMAGGRVALTVPTSMEAFFGGEAPQGKQPAIVQPTDDIEPVAAAFNRGFDVGYKAMIDSIRDSINQVMQQMQIPENFEMPEGMMMPGQ